MVPRSYYSGAWSADSAWFFYTVHDDAYRPFQVWRHRVGTDVAGDVLVLEEPDVRFEVQVRSTRTGDRIVAWSESNTTSECWVVDAHQATLFGDYRMGLELLLVNAALTFGGLWAGSRPAAYPQPKAA